MAERATGNQNNCSSLGQFALGAVFKQSDLMGLWFYGDGWGGENN
jgi:hypothetical protein